jgi:hypothetical protein
MAIPASPVSFSRWENVMSTQLGTTAPARPALSVRNKVGLVLAILAALWDVAFALIFRGHGPDTAGPPMAVLIGGTALAPVTIIAAISMWVSRNRVGGRIVAGTRILWLVGAIPAFLIPGTPAPALLVVAAGVVGTIVCVMLVLARPKPTA